MTEPLPFDRLVAYATGELDASETSRLTSTIAGSPVLLATVERLREIIQTLHADDSENATSAAIERAFAIGTRASITPSWLDRAAQVVASLIFDSRAQPAIAGFRGGAGAVQLAYECAGGRVDLRLATTDTPIGDAWKIRGQIAFESPRAPSAAALLQPGSPIVVTSSAVDEHGRFNMTSGPGQYDLIIQIDGGATALVIRDFAIG